MDKINDAEAAIGQEPGEGRPAVLAGEFRPGTSLAMVQRSVARLHHLRAADVELKLSIHPTAAADALHYHLIVVCSGAVKVRSWKMLHSLGQGDIVGCHGWLPCRIDFEGEVEAIVVSFPTNWAFKEILGSTLISISHEIPGDFIGAPPIRQLITELIGKDVPASVAPTALLMLAGLLRSSLHHLVTTAEKLPARRMRMGRLLSALSINFSNEGYSPHDAAKELGCSVRTLHKTCSDHGTTFNQLLIDSRIGWAAFRLSQSKSRISEIAFECGFSSLSHFCRVFKSYFGVSARRYRERLEA